MSKKISNPDYEVFGETDYEILPTGLEEMKSRRMEMFKNGGKFTNSECILPDHLKHSKDQVAVDSNKPGFKANTLKFWRKKKPQESKFNIEPSTASNTLPTERWNLNQELGKCNFPEPTGPVGLPGFENGDERTSCGPDDVGYEVVDTHSVEPSPVRLPFYVYTPRPAMREEISYTTAPQMIIDPQEPTDDYMDMDTSYKELSPFFTDPKISPIRSMKKVNKDPEIIPPIRRTICYTAVHSHEHSILRKEYHQRIPALQKRSESLGSAGNEKKPPVLLIKPKRGSGYDIVPNMPGNPSKPYHNPPIQNTPDKIINEEIQTKIEPRRQENNRNDIIPSFVAVKPKKPNSKENTPHKISNVSSEQRDNISNKNFVESMSQASQRKAPNLYRSDSTPGEDRSRSPTKFITKSRAYSVKKIPPVPPVRPRPLKRTEAVTQEKNAAKESSERTRQDLEKHLKGYKLLGSMEANSEFKQLNHYHESPSKGLAGLQA